MSQTFGWLLQFGGLVLVGIALLVGLLQGQLRTEIALMAVGGVSFLIGRRLYTG